MNDYPLWRTELAIKVKDFSSPRAGKGCFFPLYERHALTSDTAHDLPKFHNDT